MAGQIKSDDTDLVLNAGGSGSDIKFQSNGSEVASISDGGVVTATTFTGASTDATKLPLAGGTMTGNIVMADDTSIGIGDSAERIEFDGAGDICFLGCNVGIGTTTVASPENNSEPILQIGDGSNAMSSIVLYEDGNKWEVVSNNDLIIQDESVVRLRIAQAGDITFSDTSQAAKVTIKNDGKVGIGTTAPISLLDITHTATSTPKTNLTLSASSIADGGGTGIFLKASDNTTEDRYGARIHSIRGSGGATDLALSVEATGGSGLTEAMRISSGGNVGIGVSSPYSSLDVKTTAETTGALAGHGIRLEAIGAANETIVPITASFVSSQDRARAGIGFIAQDKDSVAGYAGSIGFYTRGAADGSQLTKSDERMRLTSGGSLYIGNTGGLGSEGLQVSYAGNAASGIRVNSNTTNNSPAMLFSNDSNGVVGEIRTSGSSTAFNTSSDYRLKENVDYTWDATTRLKQLKPARFNFIADNTNTLVDGFIAHEVSSVVPEAISGEKDAMEAETFYTEDDVETQGENPTKKIGDVKTYSSSKIAAQGIDQSKLVPLLVKTIQELEARITALEG